MNFESDDIYRKESELPDELIFISKGLESFIGTNKNVDLSKYKAQKPKLPEGLDLLNVKGAQFAKYRYEFKSFLLPYENVILGKYEKFFNLGFFPMVVDYGTKVDIVDRPLKPTDRIRCFSTRVGEYEDVPYTINDETYYICINIDYGFKAESFTKAALERYAYKGEIYDTDTQNVIVKKGFSNQIYNKFGKCIKTENKGLYDGIIHLLAEDIIFAVTKTNPRLATKPSQSCKNPFQLMNIAREIRCITNTNTSSIDYSPKKDALVYDLFVNGELTETKNIIDNKCKRGTFDLLNDMVEDLSYIDSKDKLNKKYQNIIKMINWIKNI